jgi:hypothetical protein
MFQEPESPEAETGLDPEVAKFKQEYLALVARMERN